MRRHTEVLVVGAGPAGLAAATAAARSGVEVTLLDDNLAPGGQIWRNGLAAAGAAALNSEHNGSKHDGKKTRALEAFRTSTARLVSGRRIVDAPAPKTLCAFVEATQTLEHYTYDRLILATGARERFLPFPGWTLPGVFGAGGLQAVVQGGLPVTDKRVVVAGTGPLLLAVAAHLSEVGAAVVAIAEQASLKTLAPFALTLLGQPGKILQGARYKATLGATPYRLGTWVVSAEGTGKLEQVSLTDGARTWTEACDLLACGFHLVPNTELPSLLGCALSGDFVRTAEDQQTSVADVFCVGEPTGIAGVDGALLEGEIAGLAAAGRTRDAARLFARRDREQSFGRALARAFSLRAEIGRLARADTIVCRCEDVAYAQLEPYRGWTEAKLQTRCGMGPCQGRICGPATQTLFGWRNTSIRPPLFPVPLSALAGTHDLNVFDVLQETP